MWPYLDFFDPCTIILHMRSTVFKTTYHHFIIMPPTPDLKDVVAINIGSNDWGDLEYEVPGEVARSITKICGTHHCDYSARICRKEGSKFFGRWMAVCPDSKPDDETKCRVIWLPFTSLNVEPKAPYQGNKKRKMDDNTATIVEGNRVEYLVIKGKLDEILRKLDQLVD
jgi:hypothetical protein